MAQPDLLFVILDDWGIIDCTPTLTPNIYAFGTTGGARTFTRTYSMPICSQSRACMTFGRYGRTLGIIEGMSPFNGPEPDANESTLATEFADAGYDTALIGKWHLGRNPLDIASEFIGAPQVRGFNDWLAGSPENLDDFFDWLRVDNEAETQETVYATAAQVDAALGWWASAGDSIPRFMQVSLNSPHGPYHFPPADELGGFVSAAATQNRKKYESEIRSADWAFGQLLAAVGPSTVVCVVGDNGTPVNARAPGQDPSHLKATCYEGGIRVPMAIRSGYPAGATDRLVHVVDIPATLLTLAGCAVPGGWDGMSLTGPARTTCLSEAQLGLSGNNAWVRAAMTKRYKLLRTNDEPEEFYDLLLDPNELTKLPLTDAAHAATLATLRGVLYSE